MDKSIFTALNSMQILKNNQSVLAQNLSNTNSVGFKKLPKELLISGGDALLSYGFFFKDIP